MVDNNTGKYLNPENPIPIPDEVFVTPIPANLIIPIPTSTDCNFQYYCLENWVFRNYTKTNILFDDILNSIGTAGVISETICEESGDIIIFANGYRPKMDLETSLNVLATIISSNPSQILVGSDYEHDPSTNDVYYTDRYSYWGGMDGLFINELQSAQAVYMDGHNSIITSNHLTIDNFGSSFASTAFAKKDVLCDNSTIMLNDTPNDVGFFIRRANGRIAGDNLIIDILNGKLKIKTDEMGNYKQRIDIVAHSMGYAYALGVIDAIKESGLGLQFDRFYIIAPENACSTEGTFTIQDFEEVWQYGSNLGVGEENGEDPCKQQDGVAPQCGAFRLDNQGNSTQFGREFIPKNVKTKGFVDSHLGGNYGRIFGLTTSEDGYIDDKK